MGLPFGRIAPLSVLFAIACGPSPGGSVGGSDSSESDTAHHASTGAASSASGASSASNAGSSSDSSGPAQTTGEGPIECPPNFVYVEPGCGPGDPAIVELPGPGCYEVCDEPMGEDPCVGGTCARALVNPCVCEAGEGCCNACGAEQWLCLAGEVLEPGFEQALTGQDGCGLGNAHLYAYDEDRGRAISLGLGGDLLTQAQETGRTVLASWTLPHEEVELIAVTGPRVAFSFCTDVIDGTVLRTYTAGSGTVDVTVEPALGGSEPVVTAVLTDVVFEPDDNVGAEAVTVASYTFAAIPVWCCPG